MTEPKQKPNTANSKTQPIVKVILLVIVMALVVWFALPTAHADTTNTFADERVLVEHMLKGTFKETTFTHLEPSPLSGFWQAEISNQIVYFSPEQELLIFGEIYSKDGRSLSEETRQRWQGERILQLDTSAAVTIGNGPLEVVEFSDPDCPFCQRLNTWLEAMNDDYKAKHNQDLFTRRVVMTPIVSLHPNAPKESIHFLCSDKQERRQVLTNLLNGTVGYGDMQTCQVGRDLLAEHDKIVKAFGITATPTLIIGKQIVQGFNQTKLGQIINDFLDQKTGS